jgi:importin subunit alpha-1
LSLLGCIVKGLNVVAVIDAGALPIFERFLKAQIHLDVKNRISWILVYMTYDTKQRIKYAADNGLIKLLCDLLCGTGDSVMENALIALKNILTSGLTIAAHNNYRNVYAEYIYEAGGLEKLKSLQNHPDMEIYEKVGKILIHFKQSTQYNTRL